MSWTPIVGQRFTPAELDAYLQGLVFDHWRPQFVVVHNTGSPTIAQRPHGFTLNHIANLVTYYRDNQHWSAGPHAFVDQNGIWVFTPFTAPGVHSPSWNHLSWGVEMLGDYHSEPFADPIRENLLACLTVLHRRLGLDPSSLRLHKEDPLTKHDCPGKHIDKPTLVTEIVTRLTAQRASQDAAPMA
jgi:hypothetical protein